MGIRLFLETSNLNFQLALHNEDTFLYRSDHDEDMPDSQLHSMLSRDWLKSGQPIKAISEIVVDVGPGGLTSTRSGIAFANGLSFAKSIPIVEVDSIELMVLETNCADPDRVIGARRSNEGKYFLGFYQGQNCQHLALGKPEDLIREQGWQQRSMTWIGPTPPQWNETPPELSLTFVDRLSPGLDAFAMFVALPGFAERPRCRAAGPINEKIR